MSSQFVGMFMFCFHTKFHMSGSSGSLFIFVKLEAIEIIGQLACCCFTFYKKLP
jgi:hypothetical protein